MTAPWLQEFASAIVHEVFDPVLKATARLGHAAAKAGVDIRRLANAYARRPTTGRLRRAIRKARAEHRRVHPKAHRGGKW